MSGLMERGRVRWARLRTMERPELTHRLRESARVQLERIGGPTSTASAVGLAPALPARLRAEGNDGILRYLHECVAPRFWFRPTPPELLRLRTVFEERLPRATARSLEQADAILDGNLPLLGREPIAVGPEIDWHRDPFSGARWPVRFWADYDLVSGSNPGDPKLIHELNRHQHLPRLAIGYLLGGDERHARAAIEQMRSWIEQNPVGTGVNWHSSLEISLRLISWFWTLVPLTAWSGLEPEDAAEILASARAQLDHVRRYLSTYSSPNTHLLGEAAALWMGALLLPELDRRSRWLACGHDHLSQQAREQVLPDGAHAELSTAYHCYSLDFYLLASTLARRNGQRLGTDAEGAIARQADFVCRMTRHDGTLPALGDDDGGRALALDRRSYRTFTDGLGTAGVLLGRDDLIAAAGGLHPETLWLVGPDAADRTPRRGCRPAALPVPVASFPDAGYHTQRAGKAHLVFDTGGLGYLGGGHGHADALSIVLHTGRVEMLVDPGTGVYNGAPEVRDGFRSTRAHNTIAVDGLDQSRPGGTFGWSSKASARIDATRAWPGLVLVEGSHDGYRRLAQPVTHRRRVLRVADDYWLVFDDLTGDGEHDFDLHYHLAPGSVPDPDHTSPRRHDGGIGMTLAAEGDRLDLHVAATGGADAELVAGERLPWQGWSSDGYGEVRPAPVLRIAARERVPCGFITSLVPGEVDARVESVPTGDTAVAGVRIRRGRTTDLALLAPGGASFHCADLQMAGELVWLRFRDGEPVRLLGRCVQRLRWRARLLVGDRDGGDWVEWDARGRGREA